MPYLYICLAGAMSDLEMTQLKGIQNLQQGNQNGVLATCSMAFFTNLTDFNTADESCKKFHIGTGSTAKGNLVTVNTEEKNADLQMLLEMAYPKEKQPDSRWANTKWVWAGLRKTKNNMGEESNRKYKAEDWQWADGSTPGKLSKWMPKQPDQASLKNGKKGCNEAAGCYQNQMRINNEGKWDDTFKFQTHPYACDYQGKYILSSQEKSWEDAKTACANAGLQLAKIRSDGELQEILAAIEYFFGPGDKSWKKFDSRNWFWLGGNDIKEEGTWTWLDGEKIEPQWDIPWDKKSGNDNSKKLMKEGQDVLCLSRFGTTDDSFRLGVLRPFVCQCPGS